MKKILSLFLIVVCLASCDQASKQTTSGNSTVEEQVSEPTIIGNWQTTITQRNGVSFDVYFNVNSDGTATMGSRNAPKQKHIDNIKWSKNGNSIYLYKQGEREVGVLEILSLDKNSLVVHPKGEPEDEIMYFTRK